MNKSLIVFVPLMALLLMGVTWIKLTPGGEKVRVLEASEISSCKSLGKTIVSVQAKIVGIKRSRKKVRKELQTMGRNSAAADFEAGDTIVSASEIQDGKQTFAVYKCVDPGN